MTKTSKYYENLTVNGLFAIKDGTQSTGRILTSDSGGTATWSNQSILTGGTGGVTGLTIANTVFVSKNGNDSTGLIERLDLPFSSITAARAATIAYYTGATAPSATNRLLIKVLSGTYNEQLVLANFVDWDLTDSIIDLQSGAIFTIDDNGVQCDSIIYGNGQIRRSTAGTNGCLRTQNASTYLRANFHSITHSLFAAGGFGARCQGGTQIITVASGITSNANICAYCTAGSQTVYSNTFTTTGGGQQAVRCDGGVQYIYGNVQSTVSIGAYCNGGTQYVYGNVTGTTGGQCNNGLQTIYGNILGTSGIGADAGNNTGTQIVYGNVSGATYGAYCTGTVSQQVINGDITGVSGGVVCGGGGGTLRQTINNSRISTAVNTDCVLETSSDVLILNNCTLLTSGTGKSLAASSVVKIYGVCQANTAVGAGVTQQVGTITVSVNVT